MKIYVFTSLISLLLCACGGGGGASPNTDGDSITASLSARLLGDNKVELSILGAPAQATRFCILQDATVPQASHSCFGDADSSAKTQQKTLATPSDTQRVSFKAWLLQGSSVSLHASVSVPGRSCSSEAHASANASTQPTVCMLTEQGESVLALEPAKAPITVANFLRYVNQGFYDQTVFHRFLKGSTQVVQGGGYSYGNGAYAIKNSTQSPIVLEPTVSSGLSNTAGTIAMARTSDPDSATAGFFVNTGDNSGAFDSTTRRDGYAVFGRFIQGAATWTLLLNSVSGTGEVINPAPPVWLHWAYQIK